MSHGMTPQPEWDAKEAQKKADRDAAKTNPDKGKKTASAVETRLSAVEKILGV